MATDKIKKVPSPPPPPPTEPPPAVTNKGLDWKVFFSILIPGILTVIGWFIVNSYSANRDSNNKAREIKLTYLI